MARVAGGGTMAVVVVAALMGVACGPPAVSGRREPSSRTGAAGAAGREVTVDAGLPVARDATAAEALPRHRLRGRNGRRWLGAGGAGFRCGGELGRGLRRRQRGRSDRWEAVVYPSVEPADARSAEPSICRCGGPARCRPRCGSVLGRCPRRRPGRRQQRAPNGCRPGRPTRENCPHPRPMPRAGVRAPRPGELAIVEVLANPKGNDLGREWLEVLSLAAEPVALADLHVVRCRHRRAGRRRGPLGRVPESCSGSRSTRRRTVESRVSCRTARASFSTTRTSSFRSAWAPAPRAW